MTVNQRNTATDRENREESRTHLFVIAALKYESGSLPVHIRNMSKYGALLEATSLPGAGTKVTLQRGSLTAPGRVAWTDNRRAGISFDAGVFVGDWMSRLPGAHQLQVDQLIISIKHGLPEPDAAPRQMLDILTELALLKADLTQLGNSLASDMIMVATHPELQLLDISLQRVDRIAARLKNPY